MNSYALPIWLLAVISIILGFIYIFEDIITPFIVGFVLAYFIVPAVNMLEEKACFNRSLASVVILILVISLIIAFFMVFVPFFVKQIKDLISLISQDKDNIYIFFDAMRNKYLNLDNEVLEKITSVVDNISSSILGFFTIILQNMLLSSFAIINVISFILVTPVVFFYCLLDWKEITENINSAIPKSFNQNFDELSNDVHKTMYGFIKGQVFVCFVLAILYSIAFVVIGFSSSLALGIFCGFMAFIPFIGTFFSFFISIIIAIIEFQSVNAVFIVLGTLCCLQILEGYFLVPKFVGKNVNLHPVWIIFGLMAGGIMMGIKGIIIGLPLTAFIAVLIRFMFKCYKENIGDAL